MKIISIIGTRPNFIKLSPLIDEFASKTEIDHIIVHTGQHYDINMSQIFFDQLSIPVPDHHLNVGSGTLTAQTAQIMSRLESVFNIEKPDKCIVIGDVNSTLAGAITAAQMKIELAHIESGLRSFNKTMPEEVNRILTDHASDILFAPTENAYRNLEKEGLLGKTILSGDIMYDSLLRNMPIAQKESNIQDELNTENDYFLVTLHRPYNVDDLLVLENILSAFEEFDEQFIFPIHPRTKKNLENANIIISDNVKIVEPVGYLDMLVLEKNSKKIITDSGGVQKEAYLHKVPCITLRSETEWVETLDSNCNIIVKDREKENIVKAIGVDQSDCFFKECFGNGDSKTIIINRLLS